jgi:hypothetical protein
VAGVAEVAVENKAGNPNGAGHIFLAAFRLASRKHSQQQQLSASELNKQKSSCRQHCEIHGNYGK